MHVIYWKPGKTTDLTQWPRDSAWPDLNCWPTVTLESDTRFQLYNASVPGAIWWKFTGWRPGVVDWSGGVFASCLPRVQLYVNACNGWPQFPLKHHWLLPINCHFLRLYSEAGREIAAVSSAIEESDLYLYPGPILDTRLDVVQGDVFCFLLARPTLIPALCKSLTYLFSYLLIYFFKNRPVLFPGWRSWEATKPGFSFFCLFLCYSIFCYGCIFLFVVL